MLPFVLLACACLAMVVPEWGWPIALVCVIGALLGKHEDDNRDEAYERAEAVGYDMSGDRRGDMAFDLLMAILFLLPFLLYFFGGN